MIDTKEDPASTKQTTADLIAELRDPLKVLRNSEKAAIADALEALAAENKRLRGIVAMFTKVCDHAATMNFGPGGQCCIACGLMLPPGPIIHGDANAGGGNKCFGTGFTGSDAEKGKT